MAQSKRRNIKNNKKNKFYNPYDRNTFSNCETSKPKNFKVIDGINRIYSCDVDIYAGYFNEKIFDKINLKFKQDIKTRELDEDFISNELHKYFEKYLGFSTACFMRDRSDFWYLYSVELSLDEYKIYKKTKQNKDRIKKLNNILNER